MKKECLDYKKAIEIAPGIYWVGYNIKNKWFQTNAYLVVEGDEAVLIDPGSQTDFSKVFTKIKSVCSLKKLKHVILHHQDPDLCGSTSKFETVAEIFIYVPQRAAVFIDFYGINSLINPISQDGEVLEFKTGRKLRFFLTPYCHSPGAMVTYDEKSKILFSSDIFGAFYNRWELYADMVGNKTHLESVKSFMEPYMASKEAVMNFVNKAEKLKIKMICPQHGSIIRKDISGWFDKLKKMRYGTALKEGETGL